MEEKNEQNNNASGQSNPLALAGFIVALCSLLINFGGIVGLVATVLSGVGLSKVKATGKGKGFAIAGLVIGIISIIYGIYSIYVAAALLSNL
ncbi:MAG: hypothetical protein K2H53_04470 [Clostridia bacterium]|nr:hypothetical protein [Clostridia bacterium]